MSSSDARRDLLMELIATLAADEPLGIGSLFRSPAITCRDANVAFIGHTGGLIVKVAEADAARLVAEGRAEPLTMGTRTMREWVVVAASADRTVTLERWRPVLAEAVRFRLASA